MLAPFSFLGESHTQTSNVVSPGTTRGPTSWPPQGLLAHGLSASHKSHLGPEEPRGLTPSFSYTSVRRSLGDPA